MRTDVHCLRQLHAKGSVDADSTAAAAAPPRGEQFCIAQFGRCCKPIRLKLLDSLGLHASLATFIASSILILFTLQPKQVVGTTHASSDVRRLVRAVTRGLKCCQEPDAAETGLGGAYFFRSEAGAHVAIVKPCDEEPLAPNNPKVGLLCTFGL